ncbi:MAG TPA: ROK family transcriptional regulator [Verrucomicrobiae bacterium]|nr:ROK family transcriptional regulator [Verrucomicrobiae bacterium]
MKFSMQQMASVESEILKQVRAHPGISRVSLARKLQIAPSTVGNYTARLIAEGFIIEDPDKLDFEMGRPPTALRLNPDGGQFIGVDFEARNIMAMAVDFSDRPLKQAHKDIEQSDSVQAIIGKIEHAIEQVLPDNQGRLLAIGIGVPGLVNPGKGIAVHYKYISDWQNVPLAAPLAKKFGVPVYLENNARSMALAELWFGQGRGQKDWLCIGIRSGIGAGIVAGGHLQRGANNRAGEIGRWVCPKPSKTANFFSDNGETSSRKMELQEVASVRAILTALERAKQSGRKTLLSRRDGPLTFQDVLDAAKQRDHLTLEIIGVAAETLGWAVSELSFALNPSRVILAGPLTLLGEIMLQPLRENAQDLLQESGADVPAIVNSTMGEYSGALGAAALAVHEWKPRPV